MTHSITISRTTSWQRSARRLGWIGGMALLLCACRTPLARQQSSVSPPLSSSIQARDPAFTVDGEEGPVEVTVSSESEVINAAPPRQPKSAPVRMAVYQDPPAVSGSALPPIHQPQRVPFPQAWDGRQMPPGWPKDEYLMQGGDREQHVNVARDWSVDNLDSEDAVVHYHTLEGELVVQPTNRIPIYAPRFGSVRRIDGMIELDGREKLAGYDRPTGLVQNDRTTGTFGLLQQQQPQHNLVSRSTTTFRDQTQGLAVNNQQGVLSDRGRAKLAQGVGRDAWIENINTQKPRLGSSIDRPQTGLIKQQAQVTEDKVVPSEKANIRGPGSLETYRLREGKSLLEITKSSNRSAAQPGETITFTIQFKNVGTFAVGNVTIVDHLTSRLEYIDGSEASSLAGDFFAIESTQEGSTILRWEITEPLEVGDSGQVTFECRVR